MTTKLPKLPWLWTAVAFAASQLALLAAAALGLAVTYNHGIGFGLLAEIGPLPLLLELAGALVVLLGAWSWPSGHQWPEGLVLGGTVGNLFDRLLLGAVPDPFRIPPYPFSFNLADLLIRLGLIAWVLALVVGHLPRHRLP